LTFLLVRTLAAGILVVRMRMLPLLEDVGEVLVSRARDFQV
jgi:hypothetical protein